jgi:hypothetical protein
MGFRDVSNLGRCPCPLDQFCVFVPDVPFQFDFFVELWPTRESLGMARGLRVWALGVDSGPRGGAVEGIVDPPKMIKNIYLY